MRVDTLMRRALLAMVLLGSVAPALAAQRSGSAASARSRPVSSAAGRAVNAALKTTLANAGARAAVRSEVLRQLQTRRPFALVNGHWVSVVDLASVYDAAAVRPVLHTALGSAGPQLIADARVSPDRFMLVFTPVRLGGIVIPDFARDITATIGVDALQGHMTGVGPLVLAVVLGVSGTVFLVSMANTVALLWEWLSMQYNDYTQATGPNVDFDGDGIPNKDDEDDDNDGVNDDKDNYPHDPTRSICDCGRPVIAFNSRTAGDLLPSLVAMLTAAQQQQARAASLGALASGQTGALALIF